MKNLFRRMTHHDIRFQIDSLLLGAFTDGDETALVALAPFVENGVKLRTLGNFRWPDDSQDEELGFHVRSHRQRNIQSMLRVRRRVKCHQYPLKSNKYRASHGVSLYLFCGGLPLD